MKSTVAGIGSLVPAGAAVMGSVALSLLVPPPPPAGLLPGTAPAAANNGRWSSATGKTWKAAATKQSTRTQKGKPPWAGGQGNSQPTTTTTETPAVAAPDTSETPPGQAKTPPGQDKTPPGQDKKGQSPQG